MRLYSNIAGIGETIFFGNSNIDVGDMIAIRPSYSAGWASMLTSDITTISGGKFFGIVLPSHVTRSCLADEHPYTGPIPDIELPNAIIVEKDIVGTYGVFSPPSYYEIKYNSNPLRNIDWDQNAMIDDNWCSSYTPVLKVTQPTLIWDCTLRWGSGLLYRKFDSPQIISPACTDTVWIYWLEPQEKFDDENFKIGVDSINNVITVEALASGFYNGDVIYPFKVYYKSPDGFVGSFDFSVEIAAI